MSDTNWLEEIQWASLCVIEAALSCNDSSPPLIILQTGPGCLVFPIGISTAVDKGGLEESQIIPVVMDWGIRCGRMVIAFIGLEDVGKLVGGYHAEFDRVMGRQRAADYTYRGRT
ncbi:uncharacterized protein G2W53_022586 [Senna tora]|uniref:Uncharacterized protein n=1 Tax=Senna tora TaxID=362788 RepID=A0A834TMS2_9FABA|nr:uncharacterized protein G2W53_022586 [Senna tora]